MNREEEFIQPDNEFSAMYDDMVGFMNNPPDNDFASLFEERSANVNIINDEKVTEEVDDKKKFITITFGEKQILSRFLAKKTEVEYCRILAPDNFTYIRPADKIKPSIHGNKKCFSVPEDYEILLSRDNIIESPIKDINGNIIKEGVYEKEELTVTAATLNKMYKIQREEFKDKIDKDTVTIVTDSERVGDDFYLEDHSKGTFKKITAPGGLTCIRPSNQIHFNGDKATFRLSKEYNVNVVRNICVKNAEKDTEGNIISKAAYDRKKYLLTAEQYAKLFEKMKIIFEGNRIVGIVKSTKDEREFARIMVQDGYTFLYPSNMINDTGNGIMEFEAYGGYGYRLQKGIRKEDVPDSAPEEEKYENEYATISAIKLSEIVFPRMPPTQSLGR